MKLHLLFWLLLTHHRNLDPQKPSINVHLYNAHRSLLNSWTHYVCMYVCFIAMYEHQVRYKSQDGGDKGVGVFYKFGIRMLLRQSSGTRFDYHRRFDGQSQKYFGILGFDIPNCMGGQTQVCSSKTSSEWSQSRGSRGQEGSSQTRWTGHLLSRRTLQLIKFDLEQLLLTIHPTVWFQSRNVWSICVSNFLWPFWSIGVNQGC